MAKRSLTTMWGKAWVRGVTAFTRTAVRAGSQATLKALKARPAAKTRRPTPAGKTSPAQKRPGVAQATGHWLSGSAASASGARNNRNYSLYRPDGAAASEPWPLLVMLHGCGQNAQTFATATRMNKVAAREHFWVLYPEQERRHNAQGCWNWFATRSGRALGEVAAIMATIDQVCQHHAIDRERIAIAGLSAGASMAALVASRHADRFKAVVMHSGVPPGAAHSTLSALRAMQGRRAAPPTAATAVSAPVNTPASAPDAPLSSLPPLLLIHGVQDSVVAVSNSRDAASGWAAAGAAKAGPTHRVQRGQRHAMTVQDFKRRGRTVVRLVLVEALGHAWSGGAARQAHCDPRGPDASRMVWSFAAQQFAN